MSTRLTKALEFANYRVTLNNQQAQLKAKTQSLLSYSINGGTFTIDLTLITFCKQLINEDQNEVVLLDIYNNPIKIEVDTLRFTEIVIKNCYVLVDYHSSCTNIK